MAELLYLSGVRVDQNGMCIARTVIRHRLTMLAVTRGMLWRDGKVRTRLQRKATAHPETPETWIWGDLEPWS